MTKLVETFLAVVNRLRRLPWFVHAGLVVVLFVVGVVLCIAFFPVGLLGLLLVPLMALHAAWGLEAWSGRDPFSYPG